MMNFQSNGCHSQPCEKKKQTYIMGHCQYTIIYFIVLAHIFNYADLSITSNKLYKCTLIHTYIYMCVMIYVLSRSVSGANSPTDRHDLVST